MSGLNVDALMPEMTIKVTMGDFHSIHGRAMAAKERVAKEVQRMSIPELRQALEALRAGQRLAGAENGLLSGYPRCPGGTPSSFRRAGLADLNQRLVQTSSRVGA